MKSIKRLMSFNNHRTKEKRDSSISQESLDLKQLLDVDSKEMQDLKEMRHQYEGLCAVSSLVSTRAADFSSAILELAQYFIKTFGTIEDGELSKVFKIVGRVQFEISKILDIYVSAFSRLNVQKSGTGSILDVLNKFMDDLGQASHVTQTITEPTEILLVELRNMQDSKAQHDEKRQLYEHLRTRASKGRPRNGKGDAFADQQLQVVKDEFDKLSLFVTTRLDSLEQGQARSLITQAARHHTAQMNLFSRGHSSLQAVEPYMRQVARERNIDRQLSSGINGVHELDDDSDAKSDVSYIDELDDSSDMRSPEQSNRWGSRIDSPGRSPTNQDEEAEVPNNLSKEWSSLLSKLHRPSGESPHVRGGDLSGPSASPSFMQGMDSINGLSGRRTVPASPQILPVEQDTIQVTELLDESKFPQGLSSSSPPSRPPPEIPTGTIRSYDGVGFRTGSSDLSSQSVSTSGRTSVDRHSSSDADQATSGLQSDSSGLSSKLSNNSVSSSEAFQAKLSASSQKLPGPMPRPAAVGKPPVLSFVSPTLSSTPAGFTSNMQDTSLHVKRYSQSGPLTFSGSPWSGQPSAGDMTSSPSHLSNSSDVHKSGPLGRSPLSRTFASPRVSPSLSPPKMSPPRISELHKLPPPPLNPINTKPKSPIIAHSAPLARQNEPLGNSFVNATPLPPPPLGSVPRSLSLPSRQRQQRSKTPTISHLPEVDEEESPPSSHIRSTLNNTASNRANGSSFSRQVESVHKRVSSGNDLGQETGLPPSDLKFVHFNAAKSASGTPTLSSQHRKPPSPSARGGKDKAHRSDGHRADSGSYYASPVKSGGALNSPRWRSLSINDKDGYIQSIARAVAIQREFSPEMVLSLNPT